MIVNRAGHEPPLRGLHIFARLTAGIDRCSLCLCLEKDTIYCAEFESGASRRMNKAIRSREQLREQFEVERELADRLRHSSFDERRHLYRDLYDELFRRIPHHGDVMDKASRADALSRNWRELSLLRRFLHPGTSFLEIGAGNCTIAREVATRVARVYALEVSHEIVRNLELPGNLDVILYDGCTIPVASDSIDVVFSNQVVEHVHPDDVIGQFRQIRGILKRRGTFICLTPHRFSGPHDISRFFSPVAAGFHLYEYTSEELSGLLKRAGFSRVRQLVGAKGRYFTLPNTPFKLLERIVDGLPSAGRRRVANMQGFRMALDRLMLIAEK